MEPLFFSSQAALRAWFEQHHETETELLVGYYKTATGKESITWSQSVDEALCFGWIDGIRRSINGEAYCIRFTPRKPGSNWSAVNIRKAEEMTERGLMHPAGIRAFSARKDKHSTVYSYESTRETALDEPMVNHFKQHTLAWEYFQAQSPFYRKITVRWIVSAKQEITRLRRLKELIASCEAGEWIKGMRWGKK
jgi:uncharacterized protein YdeI (YjbR/CyaY-like superfamily)